MLNLRRTPALKEQLQVETRFDIVHLPITESGFGPMPTAPGASHHNIGINPMTLKFSDSMVTGVFQLDRATG